MTTFTEALALHDITCPNPALAEIEIPVHTGPQRQGDVGIWPTTPASKPMQTKATPVPPEGIAIVRGETTGGNAHILHADTGTILWLPQTGDLLALGTVIVPPDAVALLIHTDEHGVNALGPGTYRITGKREMAEEVRRVAD